METTTKISTTTRITFFLLITICIFSKKVQSAPVENDDALLRVLKSLLENENGIATHQEIHEERTEMKDRPDSQEASLEPNFGRFRRYSVGTYMSLLSRLQDARAAGTIEKILRGPIPRTHDPSCLGRYVPYVKSVEQLRYALDECAY